MASFFDQVEGLPADAVFGIKSRYMADTNPDKIDVAIGAYRTAEGKPQVLEAVRRAEKAMANECADNKEYLPILGDKKFRELSVALMLGDEIAQKTMPRIASAQSLSGTGALRLLAETLRSARPEFKKVLLPKPTWGNHVAIFEAAGFEVGWYRYWHAERRGLDIDGMIEDLSSEKGCVALLHACAHNPTGVDPTTEDWKRISDTVRAAGHLPSFDSAYQGYASGDLAHDAAAVRLFAELGHEFSLCMSYSKNFGLYCERTGCLFVVCRDADAAPRLESQMSAVARRMYSNPPAHGMRIVKRVLTDDTLRKCWTDELKSMSDRITGMRKALRDELESLGTPGSWAHITEMIGMFSFTGLNRAQSIAMTDKHHVYMLPNGRISMAGVTPGNVKRLAAAIHDVVTTIPA